MRLDSADLLDFLRPRLERLAEKGVTDLEDENQQDLVRVMARKYLEALENPLPVPAAAAPGPMAPPQQVDPNVDLCAPPGYKPPQAAPAAKRGGKMSQQERIARARQAARDASEEAHSFDGEYADQAVGQPPDRPPPQSPNEIQYDPHTGQPLIQARPLNLPPE